MSPPPSTDARRASSSSKTKEQPIGRRQRRRDRTRAALTKAAIDRFRAKGYDATTIEEITDAADISPRTFFHYFASKEEILLDGHEERRDGVIATLSGELNRQPVLPAITAALLTIVDALEADRAFFLERARLCTEEPALRAAVLRLNDRLVEAMSDVLARRLGLDGRKSLLPRLIASVANGAMRSAIDSWVAGNGRGDLRSLATQALDLVGPAIVEAEQQARSEPGRRRA